MAREHARSGGGLSRRQWVTTGVLAAVLLWVYGNWAVNWWRIATSGFDGWGTGEWLLSYGGGFVRRGLFGSLVLGLTPSGWSPVTVVTGAQVVLMGILFGLVFALFLRTDKSPTWAMVILSPAVLLHSTSAIAYQQAGPRKELLVYVALALVALGFGRHRWYWWAVGGLLMFTVATWSHEASALLLPAFLYLLWKGSSDSKERALRLTLIGGFTVVGMSAVVLAILFPGDAAIQQAMCQQWADRGVGATCDGQAIGALTLTPSAVFDVFRTQLFPRYWGYLPVVALSAIPLYAVRFLPRYWRPTVVVLVAMLPLFYLAWDYGRWIYMAATALSILALAVASSPTALEPMKVPVIAIVAYCLLWAFPGYSNEPPVLFDGWLVTWLKEHLPTAWF